MAEQNLQRIRHTDQLIFDEDQNLVGIKNPKGHGEDFLPVRTNAAGTALVSGDGMSWKRFENPQGSNIATKSPYGFMDTGAQGVNRNFHVQTVTEAHFDAVRVVLFNSHTADVTGVYAGIGVSAALGADGAAGTYTPDTFVAATWAAAASTTLLAGTADRPSVTVSDWMDISSLDRTDGGTLPVVHIRTFVPSANATVSKWSPGSSPDWLRSETTSGGRVWRAMLQDTTNAVTTPASFTSGTTAARWYPMALQYRARGIVRTLAIVGDSIASGVGASNYLNSQWWQAQQDKSSSASPIEFASFGWSGQTVAKCNLRLTDLIAAGVIGKGNLVHIQAFSPNDATPSAANLATIASLTNKATAEIIAAGGVPIIQLGSPANYAAKAWGAADAFRVAHNAKYRAAPGIRYLDMALLQAAATTNGGQYDFASGYTTDNTHPNDAGIAVVLPYAKALIA